MGIARPALDMRAFKDRMVNGTEQLLSLPVSFTGLALFRAWVTLFLETAPLPSAGGLVLDLGMAAVLVALALFAPRRPPYASGRAWCAAAALLGTAVSLAAVVLLHAGVTGAVWVCVLQVAAAAASAVYIVLWCELYAYVGIGRAGAAMALSFVLGEALTLLIGGTLGRWRLLLLVVLPALSALMFLRARSLVVRTPPGIQPRGAGAIPRVPWKLLLVAGLFFLASGACVGCVGGLPNNVSSAVNVFAGLALLVCVTYLPDRFDLAIVLRSPVLFLICALLLLPLAGGLHGATAAVLTAAGFAVFELTVFLLLCEMSASCKIPAAFLFGLEEALRVLRSVGFCLGAQPPVLFGTVVGGAPLALALVAFTALAVFGLLDRDELVHTWGVDLFGQGKINLGARHEEVLGTLVEDAAAHYGLTPRESDVLLLIMGRRPAHDICETLSISPGTLKAHCAHIYAKVGVSSRAELVEAIAATDEGVSAG